MRRDACEDGRMVAAPEAGDLGVAEVACWVVAEQPPGLLARAGHSASSGAAAEVFGGDAPEARDGADEPYEFALVEAPGDGPRDGGVMRHLRGHGERAFFSSRSLSRQESASMSMTLQC